MIARTTRTLIPSPRTVVAVALFSLLFLAACGSPAQEMPAPTDAEQETTEASAVENESMAEADDAMADDMEESTDASEAMDSEGEESISEESMDEDSEHMDDSAMSETAPMTDTAQADGEMADEAMADEPMATVDLPVWQQLALADARTGEPFTFADFNGKTVFVEPMATWCSNCRRQLTNVQEASTQFGDDVVFVALSVETNITGDELATYADNAGFDYAFAVMTPEMLTELAGAFGQTISNPPATPHFIIRPDGSTTDLVTGIEPAADIVAQLEATRG